MYPFDSRYDLIESMRACLCRPVGLYFIRALKRPVSCGVVHEERRVSSAAVCDGEGEEDAGRAGGEGSKGAGDEAAGVVVRVEARDLRFGGIVTESGLKYGRDTSVNALRGVCSADVLFDVVVHAIERSSDAARGFWCQEFGVRGPSLGDALRRCSEVRNRPAVYLTIMLLLSCVTWPFVSPIV